MKIKVTHFHNLITDDEIFKCTTPSRFDLNGPPFCSVTDVPGVNFQQTHVVRQSVLSGLLRPADRSRPLRHQHSAYLNRHRMFPYISVYIVPSHLQLPLHVGISQFGAGLSLLHETRHIHLIIFISVLSTFHSRSNVSHPQALHRHIWRLGH